MHILANSMRGIMVGLMAAIFTLNGLCAWAQAPTPVQGDILVAGNAVWKYLDDGADQGTAWREPAFDDSKWPAGPAQLGYGDGDEATVVRAGNDPNNKIPTTYFRHAFEVAKPEAYKCMAIQLVRDDGAIVYLNGQEIYRTNMPAGPAMFATLATVGVSGEGENQPDNQILNCANLLKKGKNILAVEIHQNAPTSSDVSFALQAIGMTVAAPAGPYTAPGAAAPTPVAAAPAPPRTGRRPNACAGSRRYSHSGPSRLEVPRRRFRPGNRLARCGV